MHDPIPADHEALAVIGQITTEWAQLEHTLNATIWALAKIDPHIGACITGQYVNFNARFDAIAALVELRGLKLRGGSNPTALKDETGNLAKKRNRAIHDAWYVDHISGALSQFRSMTPPARRADPRKFGADPVSLTELRALLDSLSNMLVRVRELQRDIHDKLQASF